MATSARRARTGRRARAIDDLVVDHSVIRVTDDNLAWAYASGVAVGQAARVVERGAGQARPAIGEQNLPVAMPTTVDQDNSVLLAGAHTSIVHKRLCVRIRDIPKLVAPEHTSGGLGRDRPTILRRNYRVRYGLPP